MLQVIVDWNLGTRQDKKICADGVPYLLVLRSVLFYHSPLYFSVCLSATRPEISLQATRGSSPDPGARFRTFRRAAWRRSRSSREKRSNANETSLVRRADSASERAESSPASDCTSGLQPLLLYPLQPPPPPNEAACNPPPLPGLSRQSVHPLLVCLGLIYLACAAESQRGMWPLSSRLSQSSLPPALRGAERPPIALVAYGGSCQCQKRIDSGEVVSRLSSFPPAPSAADCVWQSTCVNSSETSSSPRLQKTLTPPPIKSNKSTNELHAQPSSSPASLSPRSLAIKRPSSSAC